MHNKDKKVRFPGDANDLRQRADEKIRQAAAQPGAEQAEPRGIDRLVQELQVHQIELELQNNELRRVQHELETSRACYFDLYNLAPVGYCTIDQHEMILEANLTAATLLGVARGALVKQSIRRFICPDDQDIFSLHSKQLLESGAPQVCELRLQRLDATFWARLEGNLAHGADGAPVCRIVLSDINTLKQSEETLRKSEEKYRTVANFTHDWEFWLGPDGDFIYCSPSCQRVTGHAAAAFLEDPSLLRAIIHPYDLAAFDQHRHEANDQKIGHEFEFRIICADSPIHWIWLAHTCQPVYDDKGHFLGTRGSNRDITDRKHLEAEAAKNRNLAALGVLAGGIAHDFNNLFQGLLGNISLAKMETDPSSKAFPYLEKAEQVYGSATKLTSQLVAFSTGGITLLTTIQPALHLRKEADSTLDGSGLLAEFDVPDDLWQVKADPAQFHEVIKQLVRNAMDAMSPAAGGKIKIVAANESAELTHGRHPTLAPGNYVRISIEDQGCGISREHLPAIFDPYFSTKQRSCQKGMGLGLALCDAIIKKFGGAIQVESEPGRGSTFHIYLPALGSAAQKTGVTNDQGAQGPRILLMEDDHGVLEVTTTLLRRSGYRVDSTMDGEAAIAAYQEARAGGDPYKVVILDLIIPGGMGGQEVIAILKKIDPAVQAIVSSGYADDNAMTNFAAHGFVAACAKPYRLSELQEIVGRFV